MVINFVSLFMVFKNIVVVTWTTKSNKRIEATAQGSCQRSVKTQTKVYLNKNNEMTWNNLTRTELINKIQAKAKTDQSTNGDARDYVVQPLLSDLYPRGRNRSASLIISMENCLQIIEYRFLSLPSLSTMLYTLAQSQCNRQQNSAATCISRLHRKRPRTF